MQTPLTHIFSKNASMLQSVPGENLSVVCVGKRVAKGKQAAVEEEPLLKNKSVRHKSKKANTRKMSGNKNS